MSSSNKYIVDAEKYENEAKTELAKNGWFFNRIDKYKAIELMNKAGDFYNLGKNYEKSAELYLNVLTLFLQSPELTLKFDVKSKILPYIEICNKINKKIDPKVIELFTAKFVDKYHNRYFEISEIYHQIAINYEIMKDLDNALKNYEDALTYAELCKRDCLMVQILEKMEQLNIQNNNQAEAQKNKEQYTKICLSNGLLKYNLK
jgi:tetratricopeptide (TPR) repeat protein